MAKNSFDLKRRNSLGSGSSNSSKKSIESDSSTTQALIKEPQFSLESTVGLNKLAKSALNNESICVAQTNNNDFKNLPDDLRKSLNAIRVNTIILCPIKLIFLYHKYKCIFFIDILNSMRVHSSFIQSFNIKIFL